MPIYKYPGRIELKSKLDNLNKLKSKHDKKNEKANHRAIARNRGKDSQLQRFNERVGNDQIRSRNKIFIKVIDSSN